MEHGKFGDRGVATWPRRLEESSGVDYGCGLDHLVTYCTAVTFGFSTPSKSTVISFSSSSVVGK